MEQSVAPTPLRILVIEDFEGNHQTARETLAGYDVTIVSTLEEALKAMKPRVEEGKVESLAAAAGFAAQPHDGDESDEATQLRLRIWEAHRRAAGLLLQPPFDVVMVNPKVLRNARPVKIERWKNTPDNVDEEQSCGFLAALWAARVGVKLVIIIQDQWAEHSLGAAMNDFIGSTISSGFKPEFEINGARVVIAASRFVKDIIPDSDCPWCCDYRNAGPGICPNCKGKNSDTCDLCSGTGKCKHCDGKGTRDWTVERRIDWGAVLKLFVFGWIHL